MRVLVIYVAARHCCVVIFQLNFLAQLSLFPAKLCRNGLALWVESQITKVKQEAGCKYGATSKDAG
jgi:hypothetical protein